MGKYDNFESKDVKEFLRLIANELAESNRIRRIKYNENRDSDYCESDEA